MSKRKKKEVVTDHSKCENKPPKSFTVRCTKVTFDEVYNACNSLARMNFLQTPFALFVYPYPPKDMRLIWQLVNSFSVEDKKFHIGGTSLSFEPSDVAAITGLRNEGKRVKFISEHMVSHSPFRRKYFNSSNPSVNMAKNHLKNINGQLAQLDSENDFLDDTIRLLILVLLGNFLFTHGNSAIYPALFKYVENLSELQNYNWAEAIHNALMEGLHDMRAKLQQPGKENNLGCLKGCSLLLSVWAYEKFNLCKPSNEDAFPLFRKWEKCDSVSAIMDFKEIHIACMQESMFSSYINDGASPSTRASCSRLSRKDLMLHIAKLEHQLESVSRENEMLRGLIQQMKEMSSKEEQVKDNQEKQLERYIGTDDDFTFPVPVATANDGNEDIDIDKDAEEREKAEVDVEHDVLECPPEINVEEEPNKHLQIFQDIPSFSLGLSQESSDLHAEPCKVDVGEIVGNVIGDINSSEQEDRREESVVIQPTLAAWETTIQESNMGSLEKKVKKQGRIQKLTEKGKNLRRRQKGRVIRGVDKTLLKDIGEEKHNLLSKVLEDWKDGNEVIWTQESVCVFRLDIWKVMRISGYTSSSFIDACQIVFSKEHETTSVVALSTMFAMFAITGNTPSMRNVLSSQTEGLKNCKLITMPILTDEHWHLLVVSTMGPQAIHYDSLRGGRHRQNADRNARNMAHNLHLMLSEIRSLPFEQWNIDEDQDGPQQDAASNDCGIYVLRYIEKLMGEDNNSDDPDEDSVTLHNLRSEYSFRILTDHGCLSSSL